MITVEHPQPHMVTPSAEEIAEAIANINRTSTVYEGTGNPGTPEAIRTEEFDRRVGSLATGQAVGMASLPEEFAGQQLHKFNFTAEEYAAHQAFQADAFKHLERDLKRSAADDDEEESPN